MKKIYLLIFVLLLSFQGAQAYTDYYGRKHYHFAIGITNPLSALTKYGAQIEERNGNLSYVYSYTRYTGAYPGLQMSGELQFYLRTKKRHQYYLYFKGLAGDAGFDSRKLAIYGDHSNLLLGGYDENLKYIIGSGESYVGGGAGFGRRYNFGAFFVRWNFGAKACAIVGEDNKDIKNVYRLMFAAGPASILELNFHFGLQL